MCGSAECIDPHYFAVLIGCGATVVNAYWPKILWQTVLIVGLLDGTLTEALRAIATPSTRACSRSWPRWGSASFRPIVGA